MPQSRQRSVHGDRTAGNGASEQTAGGLHDERKPVGLARLLALLGMKGFVELYQELFA